MNTSQCSGPCDAGRYGNVSGLTTSSCSGNCTAGYYCPKNTTSPTANACPPGRYSLRGWAACVNCSAGLYGNSSAMTNASCSGPCNAGRYGNVSGLTTSSCSGNCTAGYYCPTNTTSPRANICPPGRYSAAGWGACVNCSAGLYGNSSAMTNASCSGPCNAGRYGRVSGLTTSSCTGPCGAGYACPAGSTSSTANICLAGTYSLSGWAACVNCTAGWYGASSALTGASCSGPCDPGRYGSVSGLTTQSCSGPCAAGYACPAGSTNASVTACSPGTYSVGNAGVCSPCDAGKYSPDVTRPTPCVVDCPSGSWCGAGVSAPSLCPAGRCALLLRSRVLFFDSVRRAVHLVLAFALA